ncbi:hypothetical protein [Trinickia dinghuensis]|uniref:Uncharacterized protein n=1 Tax=Trinickia dinghuensis TaxID=2291023 RepID=A0A3D8K3M3_9BURK|nr:hypothetical protein [Trinickia dinghuensis]RDU99201.1 hypothetical protein DWV00_08735 [Trinickia dinghuensis]
MNVKPGDLARVVNSGSINDGAIVRVVRADFYLSFSCGVQIWEIEGENLLGFQIGPLMIPKGVVSRAIAPDQCLRRIDPDESARDEREPIDLVEPVSLEDACCGV